MASWHGTRNENEVQAHYVKAPYTDGAPEYALEYSKYTEYEGPYEFYSEVTYFFQAPEGTMEFQSEDAATEWLEANGYTSDY